MGVGNKNETYIPTIGGGSRRPRFAAGQESNYNPSAKVEGTVEGS